VVKGLKKKYQPVDMVSMVEMRQAMSAVSMKKDDDPSSLFEQISGIDNRFQQPNLKMPDEEKIAVILMATPKEYVTLLTSEQRQKGASVTLDDLQEAMLAQWRQTHNSAEQTESSEIGLAAFQGICYNCQKTGHRANNCPQEKNNNSQARGGRG
jgi:Tfp pilus assembly PilM family ATPase